MQTIKQYIYFPLPHQPNRAPRMIYVCENWGDSLKGNTNADELQAGRFEFFPARRCQIFSQRLWEDCQKWVEDLGELEERFKRMMKKGVPDPPQEPERVDYD